MPKSITIESLREVAKKNGGKLLSSKYLGAHNKLSWKCAKKHIWEATPSSIKHLKSWCPYCSGNKPLWVNNIYKIAEQKGGRCISKKYTNHDTKLKWECAKGHQWKQRAYNIYKGTWCPTCAKISELTIADMHLSAKKNGGKCLSKKYINNRTKLTWQCSEGHRWKSLPLSIRSGKWCSVCRNNKSNIKEMQVIAKSRNGKCLSKKYINTMTNLTWRCNEGHEWEAMPDSIKRGTWCPQCNSFYSESLCRTTFEQIFYKKFPKYRPSWLKNKNGGKMELDGYCSSLELAFEYQGEQHFKLSYFIKTKKLLEKRIKDDKTKKELCKENQVNLIIISYKDNLLELPLIIKKKLENKKINLNNYDFNKKINFNKIYEHRTNIKYMKQIAAKKGGRCLSDQYVNNHTKLEWECAKGHQWWAVPSSVIERTWCPDCGGSKRLKIDEMYKIAKLRGGKCLSKKYINNRTKLEWECAKGHQWWAVPSSVKYGTWCKKCYHQSRVNKS